MTTPPAAIYVHRFAFPPTAEDENHHVNNVEYVRKLQEAAIAHTRHNGWSPEELHQHGWTWVVRSHHIEYLQPCRANQDIALLTWVANFKKIRSLRKYQFIRLADRAILANAQTDWIFLDAHRNRPIRIPPQVLAAYVIVTDAHAAHYATQICDT
ncbi:MAG: acyl-CoA thioesterase [Lentisphaerae bacterium]|jgi:acyl-CoA thioester hydrolase|nr:acyl-CoA thioesterase [Lentisphaerota bacterium]